MTDYPTYETGVEEIPSGSFTLGGYHWIQTCEGMPEQYDIHADVDGAVERQVAYFRFRWGFLAVEAPDIYCDVVYTANLDPRGWRGHLDPKERAEHAERIVRALDTHYHGRTR